MKRAETFAQITERLMAETVRFRDLQVGDTFDFINDAEPGFNSFFARCTKLSERTYTYQANGQLVRNQVGSIYAPVFHIDRVGAHVADCRCNVCGHCDECQDGTAGPIGTYCLTCHRTQRH
jgi:hypothetical protein